MALRLAGSQGAGSFNEFLFQEEAKELLCRTRVL